MKDYNKTFIMYKTLKKIQNQFVFLGNYNKLRMEFLF